MVDIPNAAPQYISSNMKTRTEKYLPEREEMFSRIYAVVWLIKRIFH
jgi:hypothetical protein